MDWEDEDAEIVLTTNVAALQVSKEQEDEEEAALKEIVASGVGLAVPRDKAEPEKVKEKHIAKAKEKERAAKAAVEKEAAEKEAEEQEALLGENPAERAKRLRELQMKQEMELAAAQFGTSASTKSGPMPTDPEMLLAAVPLSDGDSFTRFGAHVAKRVHEASGTKSTLAMRFYNELLGAGAERLSSTELTALIRMLETKERTKREADKKAAGKKPTKGKAAARVTLGADQDNYDDYGDYEAPAKAAPAAAGADAPASTGNSGNVAASIAGAGLDLASMVDQAAQPGTPVFVREKFRVEEDFM